MSFEHSCCILCAFLFTWLFSGALSADCVVGYFKNNLWLQTGALVRCRYLPLAGFLSQTSDFPHTFPLPGLNSPSCYVKKKNLKNATKTRPKRTGHTEVALCVRAACRPLQGAGPVKTPRGCLRSGARSCKISPPTFTSAFLCLTQTRVHGGLSTTLQACTRAHISYFNLNQDVIKTNFDETKYTHYFLNSL